MPLKNMEGILAAANEIKKICNRVVTLREQFEKDMREFRRTIVKHTCPHCANTMWNGESDPCERCMADRNFPSIKINFKLKIRS